MIFFTMTFAVLASPSGRLKLAGIIKNHAVLQYGEPIRLWGTACPNRVVQIQFDSKQHQVTSNAEGKWELNLPPCHSTEPMTLEVSSAKEKLIVKDILMGEVWLASGQSNMAFKVRQSDVMDNYPKFDASKVRFFKSMVMISEEPEDDIYGEWQLAHKNNSKDFSAVAFQFAVEIQKKTGRPVGILQNARGGSRCETWVPHEQLDLEHKFYRYPMKFVKQFEADHGQAIQSYYQNVDAWKAKGDLQAELKNPTKDFSGYIIRKPYGLYNAMIHPLLRYRIKGVIWYQGEGNSGEGDAYAYMFPKMIKLWRERWGYDFPFHFVQLPGFIRNDLKTKLSKSYQRSDYYCKQPLSHRILWPF
jgi:hypothetical protein